MGTILFPSLIRLSTKFQFIITITFSAGLPIMLKLFLFMSLLCSPAFCRKCSVDKEVRFILKNMNPTSVEREVDCVVGIGPCDNLGARLKAEAPSAVRQGRCGKKCSCEQIQVRLVVNKMKRNYSSQWRRVESQFV